MAELFECTTFCCCPFARSMISPCPVLLRGTLNLTTDLHLGGALILSPPIYLSRMSFHSLCSLHHLLPGSTTLLVIAPHLGAACVWSAVPTFSIWHALSHSQSSLSHCFQHPLTICNSIFKAPIPFCQRAYQHVIIACLNVSLSDSTRSSLKTGCFSFSSLDSHA